MANSASPAMGNNSTTNGIASTRDKVTSTKLPTRNLRKVRKRTKVRTAEGFSVFNLVARCVVWYALYTVLFRCPQYPTSTSPGICHPAHAVKTALRPHVQPYYDIYVSPHVEPYTPYVHKANKDFLIPAYNKLHFSYYQYIEPHLAKGTRYAAGEYERYLHPHVEKAQNRIWQHVSPVVQRVQEFWQGKVEPVIDVASDKALVFWSDGVVPTYHTIQPYLEKAYEHAKYVITVIVAPVVREGGEKAVVWGRGMWSEVVRPQVGRIGERLGGSNGNGSGASSPSTGHGKSSKNAHIGSSVSSAVSSAAAAKASNSGKESSSTAAAGEKPKKLTKEEAKEIIKNDLFTWTDKFNAATEKTLTDLKAQIDEISLNAQQAAEPSLQRNLTALQEAVNHGLDSLKAEISSLEKGISEDSSSEEKNAAQEKLFSAVRRAGLAIRDKAQDLRKEAERFLAVMYDDVSEAAEQHLEVLDGINDMGIQELGMKWAWMDYVSYKDWAKYHELKKQMRESRATIVKSAEKNEKLLEVTQWVEEDWEGKATTIAKQAAEELQALKSIGKKALGLKEQSGSTDTKPDVPEPVPAEPEETPANTPEAIASSVTEKIRAKVPGGVEAGFVAAAPEVAFEEDEGVIDNVQSQLAEASKAVSQAIADAFARGTPSQTPTAESLLLKYKELDSSAIEAASIALYGTQTPATEQWASIATDKYSVAVSVASSILYGTPEPTHEAIIRQAKEAYSHATDNAYDRLASAKRLAVTRPANSDKPWRESVYSAASEEFTKTLSAVENSWSELFVAGERAKETYNAAVATAQLKLNEAVSAVSMQVKGTPQPTHQSLLSVARVQYSSAVAEAQKTYDSWASVARVQIYGTPTPTAESIASAAKEAAAQAASSVQSVASDASSAISEGIYGTPPPSGASASASSVASVAKEAAARAASSAQSVISEGVYDTPASSGVSASASSIASVASDAAAQAASSAQSVASQASAAISEGLYGTPPPSGVSASASSIASNIAESIASASINAEDVASARYEELKGLVSELIHGKEPTFSESVMARLSSAVYGTPTPFLSRASSYAAQATDAVGDAFASIPPAIDSIVTDAVSRVQAAAAEASTVVYGKEPTEMEKLQQKMRSVAQEALETIGVKVQLVEEEKSAKERIVELARAKIFLAIEKAEQLVEAGRRKAEEAAKGVKDEL